MGRHYQAVGKPTHTRGGLPIYQERRLSRLLKATDHVAPRLHVQKLHQSNRLRDATAVVKMYVSGVCVKVLGGELLRRLATNGYGKGLRPAGRVATALLLAILLHGSAFAAPMPAPDCRARPAWCVDGYTCEPTSCTTRSTVALERLGSQLVAARAQRPRWFRPFLEGGASWSPIDQAPGIYGEGGLVLWRHVNLSAELTQDDARAKIGWRREW